MGKINIYNTGTSNEEYISDVGECELQKGAKNKFPPRKPLNCEESSLTQKSVFLEKSCGLYLLREAQDATLHTQTQHYMNVWVYRHKRGRVTHTYIFIKKEDVEN